MANIRINLNLKPWPDDQAMLVKHLRFALQTFASLKIKHVVGQVNFRQSWTKNPETDCQIHVFCIKWVFIRKYL